MRKVLQWVLTTGLAVGSAMPGMALPTAPDRNTQFSTAQPQDRITRQVRHELLMLPQLSIFDNLAYSVNGDTVTLLGQVRNPVLKDEAQAAVKGIEGVQQVSNQIEILPVSFNDDRIRRQVARAILHEPRLFEYAIQPVPSIHIIVKNGHVSLEGIVSNQGDKDVAGIRANGVPGVFSVQNDLQVEAPMQARK